MVKIVSRGVVPDPRWMSDRWTCTRCKSVVMFEPGDTAEYDDEFEWHDGCAVVATCPVCMAVDRCFDRVKGDGRDSAGH